LPRSLRSSHAVAAAWVLVCGLSACLEDPKRADDQWPITRGELQAAARRAASAEPSDPGEAAYRRTCIACHGVDGQGNGGKTAADFTSPTGVLKKHDSALLASILDGATGPIGVMPAHRALLASDESTAVLAYVRKAFGPSITPEPPVAPDASVPAETTAETPTNGPYIGGDQGTYPR